MPNRILREAIVTSRAVSALSDSGQLFYRCLMSVVDDYGRFEADLDLLRARCFPRQLDRWPLSRVSEALSECGESRSSDGEALLLVYSDYDSDKKFIQINNFGQRIRETKNGVKVTSKYPAPTVAALRGASRSNDGDSPPKTEAKTETEAKAKAVPRINGTSEFPLTIAEIRKHDAAVDETFVRALVTKTVQSCLSSSTFPQSEVDRVSDKIIARACAESYATGPASHRTGLLLNRVPNIVITWGLGD